MIWFTNLGNTKMSLIFDIDSSPEIIVNESINESGTAEKKYKIRGIFSTINEKNRNGRIYPREVWEREVKEYQKNISGGTINCLMEWEHPARTKVDPMRAVAKINDLHIEGKYVMGEAVLLDNPQANQLKSLIDNGIKLSVSSRGVGSVKNGVVESFKLITYDIVQEPSDFNATMNGLVESYRLNEGILEGIDFESPDLNETQENDFDINELSLEERDEFEDAVVDRFKSMLGIYDSPESDEEL